MCGRYSITGNPAHIGTRLGIHLDAVAPRYNVAPTQTAPVILHTSPASPPAMRMLRWGLVPFWAKDLSIGNRMINARCETVAEKPSFRRSFKSRRCLVLADGFYEWQKQGTIKQPWRFHLQSGAAFAFAGLWDCWHADQDDETLSFTILTTTPNDLTRRVHDRMPVILQEAEYLPWLNPTTSPAKLIPMLDPYPAGEMTGQPVSRSVNSPKNDNPECIVPLPS